MTKELGLFHVKNCDEQLTNKLLALTELHKADITNTFKGLTTKKFKAIKVFETGAFRQWQLDLNDHLKHLPFSTVDRRTPYEKTSLTFKLIAKMSGYYYSKVDDTKNISF